MFYRDVQVDKVNQTWKIKMNVKNNIWKIIVIVDKQPW